MNNNDKTILDLKKQIEDKKKLLVKTSKFVPNTNCSIPLNGTQLNIHTMSKEKLLESIAIVKSLENGLKDIFPEQSLFLGGFSTEDWITDLKNKFLHLNIQQEKERLKKLEDKLHTLLSSDTKVLLELDELKNQI